LIIPKAAFCFSPFYQDEKVR
jgi:hypothetical protein